MSKLKGAMLHVVIIAIALLSKEKDERDIIVFTQNCIPDTLHLDLLNLILGANSPDLLEFSWKSKYFELSGARCGWPN